MYPDNLLYGEWVMWGLLITLPVNFISWSILYAAPSQALMVLFVQTAIFALTGAVLYRLLFRRYISS